MYTPTSVADCDNCTSLDSLTSMSESIELGGGAKTGVFAFLWLTVRR